MTLPKMVRLDAHFDPVRLQQDLQTAISHFRAAAQEGPYHDGSWKGIALRSVDGHYGNTMALSAGTSKDTEVLEKCPYFKEILHSFEFQTGVVRLLFLPPGKKVGEHTDKGFNWNVGMVRLHIPIVTHPDVIFEIAGERCLWQPGEFWFGDFNQPHWLHNQSDIVRVHLVLDCFVDEALLRYFPASVLEEIHAALPSPMLINHRGADIDIATLRRYEGYFKLPRKLSPVPIYGKLSARQQQLNLEVFGFPVPFGFRPQGPHQFRYLDKTLRFPEGPASQQAEFSAETQQLTTTIPVFRTLTPRQRTYITMQTSLIQSLTTVNRAVMRGKQWLKRVANAD